ncbi:MAG: hypothetical protein ACLQO1_05890 [Steroidobacteraceae bacterium]
MARIQRAIGASIVRFEKQVADPARFARGLVFRGGAGSERLIEALTALAKSELMGPLQMQAILFEATRSSNTSPTEQFRHIDRKAMRSRILQPYAQLHECE